MNKTAAGVIAAVLAIVVVGGLVLVVNRDDGDPTTSSEHSSTDMSGQKQSNIDTSTDTLNEANSSNQAVQTNTVDIKDYAYAPAKIQVKKGTVVTWTNQDSVRHNINPDKESDDFKASELLAKGETYTFTFNTVGTYTYHCSPHPYMKGTVEVIE